MQTPLPETEPMIQGREQMKPIKGKIPLGKYESYYSDLLPSAVEGLFIGTSNSELSGNGAGTEGETGNESEDGGGGGTIG